MRKTLDNYNTTPAQRYLIHRARSARWEAERNRAPLPFFVQRQSVVHGVIAGAAFAAMSMTASPPTLATDRYGRLPRSESVSIGCLTLSITGPLQRVRVDAPVGRGR